MILDSEEQRHNLLNIIRTVNVTGSMEEAIQIINMLKNLENSVQTAQVGELVAGDAPEKSIHAV